MKKLLLLSLSIMTLLSCNSGKNEEIESRVQSSEFGTMKDGTVVDQFTVTNANGIEMKAITYGGIITDLNIPDRDGNSSDVVLGYDNLEGYIQNNPYFGAIIGRYGNRIAKGKFFLDEEEYTLAANNIGNHLHGGIVGFDKVVWNAQAIEMENAAGIEFTYVSKDGEEGYPGTLSVTVRYILDDEDQLIFEYSATTDKKTIVNLTNHSYYNLTGMNDDILSHELMINAEEYLPVDSTLIPLDPENVQGTPFDFTESKVIGDDITEDHIQLIHGGGYDHCWIIKDTAEKMNFAASLYDPASGRYMEIFTTEPGIQFYSGNFLDGTINGKDDVTYAFRSGLCLETQHYPDSPNRTDFPSVVLNPGENYSSKTVTKFSIK